MAVETRRITKTYRLISYVLEEGRKGYRELWLTEYVERKWHNTYYT